VANKSRALTPVLGRFAFSFKPIKDFNPDHHKVDDVAQQYLHLTNNDEDGEQMVQKYRAIETLGKGSDA
jgi:hypothetical protein